MKTKFKRVISVFLAVLICSTLGVSVQAKPVKKYVKSLTVKSKATITIPADKKTVTKSYSVKVKVNGNASKKFTAKSNNTSVASVKVSGSKIKVTAKKTGVARLPLRPRLKTLRARSSAKSSPLP